ncbi:hypothetical protein H0H81_001489 [Sphagnurus paluster]|uniref:Protein kinase domain-containing protein n=1 Tax=Sphagnurus paluster TaxID=117069 RepID=A0A9P7KGU5_9AGAR|nr:hypothetical protein H0H81_001489 [Sphagnurus paluster]
MWLFLITRALPFVLLVAVYYKERLAFIPFICIWQKAWELYNVRYFSLPKDLEAWQNPDSDHAKRKEVGEAWMKLRPFFASRGYTLYDKVPGQELIFPPSSPKPASANHQTPPHARRIPGDENPSVFYSSSVVWAARDQIGREVVIKLVSEKGIPSTEWLILQELNREPLRSHPHNHTIHVLDHLVFEKFVFVVMPRWDISTLPPFATVSELLHFSQTWFEALDFLHEQSIAHQDIFYKNTAINAFGSFDAFCSQPGLRNAGEVQYALYDFGHSLRYPRGTDISTVSVNRFIRFHDGSTPDGPYNPFMVDVKMLGDMLNSTVVEGFENNPMQRPLARQALTDFFALMSSLDETQIKETVAIKQTSCQKSKEGRKPGETILQELRRCMNKAKEVRPNK